MAKTKFYSIMNGKHPLSRKQQALYNYLLPIINKEVILLVSKDDGRDDNILDVVNGDSFLELNQNGLAVCDTFVNENGLIEYYVICFYDTSDIQEYEKTTWDISRHPEKGENFDGLGYSDLIIIDDKGNLLKCSQKTSLFESKKSARKSIKEAFDDGITVKEFCFWGHSGNTVEIWTIDGVLCDAFEVRNVGKSEYKNYEIHGWDCVKNTMIIYIKK